MFGIGFAVVVTLLLAVFVLFGFLGWIVARSPLKRSTVERFARRQRLELTDANAGYVVSALLITHRWRRAGLVLGLLAGLAWSLQHGSISLHFLAGFLGWFVGAVVAEWRISGLDQAGQRRAAGLQPRSLARYVTPLVLAIAGVVGLVLLGAAVAAAVRAGVTWAWAGWLAYSLGVLALLWLTFRATIARPSGFVDGAVRGADDALRCHGLTVLLGSGIAVAYPAVSAFAVASVHPDGMPYSMDPAWTLLVMTALILLGLWVAVWSPSARASRVEVSRPRPPVEEAASA